MIKEALGHGQNPAEIELKNFDLKKMSLEDASTSIARVYNKTYKEYMAQHRADVSLFDLYSQFAEKLPKHVSAGVNKKAKEAITSDDPKISGMGKQVFIAVNLKTILGVIKPYLSDDINVNSDLVQDVLDKVNEKAKKFNEQTPINIQVSNFTLGAVGYFYLKEFGVPVHWIKRRIFHDIDQSVSDIGKDTIEAISDDTSEKNRISKNALKAYIIRKNPHLLHEDQEFVPNDPTFNGVLRIEVAGVMEDILEHSSDIERFIMHERFVENRTHPSIGKDLKMSRETVRLKQNEVLDSCNTKIG